MPRYTNNGLEYLQREARKLFRNNSMHVLQYGTWAGVIVNERLVVYDEDTKSWYVGHAPADQPYLIHYVGQPVSSPEEVAERH